MRKMENTVLAYLMFSLPIFNDLMSGLGIQDL